MSCNTCFDDWLCKCIPYDSILTIHTVVPDGEYTVRVTDSAGSKFDAQATRNGSGALEINISDFPDGLFTAPGNVVKIEFFESTNEGCITLKLPLVRYYDCITIETSGGNVNKEEIGCEWPIS